MKIIVQGKEYKVETKISSKRVIVDSGHGAYWHAEKINKKWEWEWWPTQTRCSWGQGSGDK